jgi:hypothetical protein
MADRPVTAVVTRRFGVIAQAAAHSNVVCCLDRNSPLRE